MKRWVLDTNVVVSGLLTPSGPPGRILDAVLDGRIKMVYDPRILAEYRDVLHRPRFAFRAATVTAFLRAMSSQVLVSPVRLVTRGPDPDDLIFVEAALSVPDKTVVTGNLADYPDKILNDVRILTPAQAVAEL